MFTSSRRSGMPDPAPSTTVFSRFPASVLLDTMVQLGSCKNETTAQGTTRTGSPIEVSFVVADPPCLSRGVVHCPDLIESNIRPPAIVTGADGAFLLIRVFFPKLGGKRHFSDIFVYRAGAPSLLLIPEPYPRGLLSSHVGVLSCVDTSEHCLVVVPEQRLKAGCQLRYNLQVFSTKMKSWSTEVAPMASDSKIHYGEFEPSKVFSVQGHSLAWVDLQFGILMCKNLEKDPEMCLIELPNLMPSNMVAFGLRSDGSSPPLDPVRDVICINDLFRFVELEFLELVDKSTSLSAWRATIFERKIGSDNWTRCHTVDSKLVPADSCLPLFPEIYDSRENKLTLNKVISSFPTLDEYKDVMYLISRVKAGDKHGWILAVNTKYSKLEKAVPAEFVYTKRSYIQCVFSNYLDWAPGTQFPKDLQKCTNREKIELLENSLVAALNQLRNMEIHMEYVKHRYTRSLPLSCTGSPLSLNQKYDVMMPSLYTALQCFPDPNQTGVKYGSNDCEAKDVSMDEHLRVMEDLELQISAPIDAIKNKIRVANGVLYNLVRSLPPDVLDA